MSTKNEHFGFIIGCKRHKNMNYVNNSTKNYNFTT